MRKERELVSHGASGKALHEPKLQSLQDSLDLKAARTTLRNDDDPTYLIS